MSRRARLRRCVLGVLLLLTGCGRGGCGSTQTTNAAGGGGTPRRGGTVVYAIPSNPATLMPYAPQSQGSPASDVLSLVFDQLVHTQADLITFRPGVARSWEWESNGTGLVFHLRPEARWSDGVPLTAEDVAFTFDVARDTLVAWPSRRWKKDFEACEVVDAHTVRFRFRRVPREAVRFAREGFILPKHLLAGVPRQEWAKSDFGRHPIGSGAFKLESWEPQQQVVLVRNEYFYDNHPYVDRFVLKIVPDKPTAVRLLRAGELDFLDDLPPRDAELMQRDPAGPRVAQCKGRDYDFIGYNLRDPLFADVRVREALTRAIDRDAITQQLLQGYAEPLDGPIVPIMWAYDSTLVHTPHDVDGAKRLFAAAGWRDSNGDGWLDRDGKTFEFELLTNADNDRRLLVVVPIQSDWKAVGVKVNIRSMERAALIELRANGQFQAVLGGWSINLAMDISGIWGCKSPRNNFIKYCNPQVDSLIEVAAYLPYESARAPLAAMQQLIAADYPYTFLYFTHSVAGVSRRLQNVVVDARSTVIDPETWWVADAPQ